MLCGEENFESSISHFGTLSMLQCSSTNELGHPLWLIAQETRSFSVGERVRREETCSPRSQSQLSPCLKIQHDCRCIRRHAVINGLLPSQITEDTPSYETACTSFQIIGEGTYDVAVERNWSGTAPPFTHWTGTTVDYTYMFAPTATAEVGSYLLYSSVSDHLPILTQLQFR